MGSTELIARPDVPAGVVLSRDRRARDPLLHRRVRPRSSTVAWRPRRGRAGPHLRSGAAEEIEPPLAPQVDALIIDLDGVIRHWDPTYGPEADRRLGIPEGTLMAVALEDRMARVVDGRLPFEAWCTEVGAE